MFFLCTQGRRGQWRRQAGPGAALAFLCTALTAGCGPTGTGTPVDWWHDLQGGVIASSRPPPPGADLPYPTIGPIPDKPTPPDKATREHLLDQLATERDMTQRVAARNPIVVLPPPPVPPPAKPVGPDDETANASLPAAEAAPVTPPPATPAAAAPASDSAGPAGPMVVAGEGVPMTGLPDIPDQPPAPATFEGVPAEPLPTPPPPVPPRLPQALRGDDVLFPTGQATLEPSQMETLKAASAKRKKGMIEITGYGEAVADTPAAQEAAIGLALSRAQAVADALVTRQHVPQTAIRINADAFGRGASIRVLP